MILIAIAVVVVAFLGFGLFKASQLQSIHITKSIAIDGKKSEVFDMVRYLNNFPKWSPFLEADPSQKYSVKGKDGTIGAQYHWDGNSGKDLGYQEIAKIEEGKFIQMKCDISKPFKAKPTFDYSFVQHADGIKVTQDFRLTSGLADAFFMWLFGVRTKMEETNARGLDLLKKTIEQ